MDEDRGGTSGCWVAAISLVFLDVVAEGVSTWLLLALATFDLGRPFSVCALLVDGVDAGVDGELAIADARSLPVGSRFGSDAELWDAVAAFEEPFFPASDLSDGRFPATSEELRWVPSCLSN